MVKFNCILYIACTKLHDTTNNNFEIISKINYNELKTKITKQAKVY